MSQIVGEPIKVIKEKPSPDEFASELLLIPKIEAKTKKEILSLLQLKDKDWKRYKSLIGLLAKRKKDEKFVKAFAILQKLN